MILEFCVILEGPKMKQQEFVNSFSGPGSGDAYYTYLTKSQSTNWHYFCNRKRPALGSVA